MQAGYSFTLEDAIEFAKKNLNNFYFPEGEYINDSHSVIDDLEWQKDLNL